MSETSLPHTGSSAALSRIDVSGLNGLGLAVALLVVAGIGSLIVGEQVLTGWLALGERANISRRHLNLIEIAVISGTFFWGGASLWAAASYLRQRPAPSMRDYFDRRGPMSAGIIVTICLLAVIGVVSLVIAEQIITGWLALGERVNISRRNINFVEWSAIVGTLALGFLSLRTIWGLYQRDRRAWAYAQWVVLLIALIGACFLISGGFDLSDYLPSGATLGDHLPDIQQYTAPGILIFLSCIAVYQILTREVELAPDAIVRNTLAKSPGAGGIIGFFAIFIFFSLASDLFLEQRSLAGLLATNITRGIVAIGITFLMISGEFDLSVGSVYGAGALVFLLMMTEGIAVGMLLAVPATVAGISLLAVGLSQGRSSQSAAGAVLVALSIIALLGLDNVVITSVLPAAAIALVFAAILGYINGAILISTGIPSFIVTLGTLLAYRAILLIVVADGRILRYADYLLPPPYVYFNRYLLAGGAVLLGLVTAVIGFSLIRSSLRYLLQKVNGYRTDTDDLRDFFVVFAVIRFMVNVGMVVTILVILGGFALNQLDLAGANRVLEISFFDLANGRFDFVERTVNLRIGVLWWFLLVLIFQFVLTQTRYGNHVFAVGGNPGAARAQGINVNRVKITNFMICSMLACLAGIINVARLSNVDPLMGDGLELEVIAASVIGGALLTGGYGSIMGALLGVLIFGMLQTGLVLIGVDARAFSGVIGVIIIIAVVINTAVRQARK